MKGSIITGGLVGIALGALATFALANGLLSDPEPQVRPAPHAGVHGAVTPAMTEDVEASTTFAPHRPIRPGSDRYGSRRQS